MKRKLIQLSLFLLLFLAACNNADQETKPATSENDIDAARNFIQSALEGNYLKARNFILADSMNLQYLDAFERNYYERMSTEDQSGYRLASININSVIPVNDSITIVSYSNSFKKKNDSLKVVKFNGQWLVDLKYSFLSKTDSVNQKNKK